ncbi:hypothetical protein PW5551_06565 [Petrotoga sp. 9PW.55.5.1]|nr:hypothetical protein PW5551_06565 [Petrotoga sp. 9PW.55.5.1]
MTILLYFTVMLINLMLVFNKKQSKMISLLTILFIILFISGAGPKYSTINHSRDYINYEISYNNSLEETYSNNYNISYLFLSKIGNKVGIDFFYFRLILISILFFILYLRIKNYTFNINLFLLLYICCTL